MLRERPRTKDSISTLEFTLSVLLSVFRQLLSIYRSCICGFSIFFTDYPSVSYQVEINMSRSILEAGQRKETLSRVEGVCRPILSPYFHLKTLFLDFHWF